MFNIEFLHENNHQNLCNKYYEYQALLSIAYTNYLNAKALQLKPLLESYNPDELPKLDYATVHVMGRYVTYTILSSADTTTAGSAMEKALTPAE